jgi:ribosomal protein S18 acetylase RimI-like enzyme
MRIAPEIQGHGIGSELLRQLELTAQKKNLKKLVLETAMSRPKTLRFYRSHGYTETGEKFYGTQKTICFEKTLEELPDKPERTQRP